MELQKLGIKEVVLGILTVTTNLAVFWLWRQTMPVVIAGEFKEYTDLLYPLGGLVIAAVLFGFSAIFIKQEWLRYGVGVLSVGVPYFLVVANPLILWGLAASVIFGSFAVYRLGKEHLLSLGFNLTKIFRAGIPLYFTVVSLTLAMFFFSMVDEERAVASLIPRSALNAIMETLPNAQGLKGAIGLTPDTTVDELLIASLKDQLQSQGVDLSKLPPGELERLIKTQRDALTKEYGLALSGKERVSEILYTAIAGRIEKLLGPYSIYLPFISALVFFFAFKALTFPLYYVTLLVGVVLIRLMAWSKILKWEKQEIVVERLTL